jgi:hypothetical protein
LIILIVKDSLFANNFLNVIDTNQVTAYIHGCIFTSDEFKLYPEIVNSTKDSGFAAERGEDQDNRKEKGASDHSNEGKMSETEAFRALAI